jgi:hypothetical protein
MSVEYRVSVMRINERVEGEVCQGLLAQLPEYGAIRQRQQWTPKSVDLSPTKVTGRCGDMSRRGCLIID